MKHNLTKLDLINIEREIDSLAYEIDFLNPTHSSENARLEAHLSRLDELKNLIQISLKRDKLRTVNLYLLT